MRLNLNKIINIIKHLREYIFPVKKLTDKFKSITSIQQLENFIQESIEYKILQKMPKTETAFNYLPPE